mgnify:CR=1 FL=1
MAILYRILRALATRRTWQAAQNVLHCRRGEQYAHTGTSAGDPPLSGAGPASTNKGHVEVKLGVGLESWRAYEQLKRARKFQDAPEPLMVEEIDLLKMIFTVNRREKNIK